MGNWEHLYGFEAESWDFVVALVTEHGIGPFPVRDTRQRPTQAQLDRLHAELDERFCIAQAGDEQFWTPEAVQAAIADPAQPVRLETPQERDRWQDFYRENAEYLPMDPHAQLRAREQDNFPAEP
jgi:hypothetical protein